MVSDEKIFSTTGHEVPVGLMSWRPSIHPSTGVNFSFKRHLLLNHWQEFDETSHECSLGDPLSSLLKWFRSIAHKVHKGENREILGQTLKIFFSETTRPIALIFGMWHRLMVLYQVCSNYAPGVKIGPAPGVTSLHRVI